MAVDATAMVGGRSDSTPRQNGASARVQQRPAAAEMIHASVKNRVDNGGTGCVSGESRPPPIGALPRRFADCRVSRRE